ncbi:hypothetical protein [Nocardioides sp. GY 10127]|uniref:hypothetical protein n=1 Tax=Nocardioides sp. GY 10127 TaxID=2569762 RepID=UPI0010A763A4|nr:hypothetical protein [Nocardioides sp. GY 10127]TIC82752.1 hypothetical protein E8D37_08675 [Nocardioides sp. GY 10127]
MTAHPPAPRLTAGAARVDITPTELAGLNPFGPDFTEVRDRLHARALVVSDGATTAALVSLDLVEVGDTTALRARVEQECGISADHVVLAPSHAHNAPRIGLVPPGGKARIPTPESLAYTREVEDAVVAAVQQAAASARPAQVGFARQDVDVNVCREAYVDGRWTLGYAPHGDSDKRLGVVTFREVPPAGAPTPGAVIAVVLNYAVHSTVLLGVRALSADLAGVASTHVEAELDGAVALWTSGSLGDQRPRVQLDEPTDDPAADARFAGDAVQAQGFMLGSAAVRLVKVTHRYTAAAPVSAGVRVVACPCRRLPVPPGMEQADVETVDLTLSSLVVGPVALAGVGGEVTVPVGRAVQEASPVATTLVVTNANARIGYLPTDESYDRRTQAAEGCPIVQGHAQREIVDGLTDLLRVGLGGRLG